MDNYYEIQKPRRTTMADIFLEDHALEWWTSKEAQKL